MGFSWQGAAFRPVPDEVFVIDAVVHAFNLSRANVASRYGEQLYQGAYMMHAGWNPPECVAPPEVYRSDMAIETLADTVFTEAPVHMASTHYLRLDGWFKDGFCSWDKTLEAARRWPQRFIPYCGVDPTQDIEAVKDDLRAQMEAMPSARGLKLYPHQIEPFRRWRTDDPKVLELFALARDLGLKVIAIHKALPNGTVPLAPYKPDDIDIAADAFPELNFEIVHAGMAFVEETAMLCGVHPNVYANLETTTSLLWRAPGLFAEALATLIHWGGPAKILFASGCALIHPRPVVELFWNFEMPAAVLEKYSLPPLSDEWKAMILGQNYAALHGLDLKAARAGLSGDRFEERKKAAGGLVEPASVWKRSFTPDPLATA